MKPLTVNVDTGSPAGFHHWKSVHECPMRSYLNDIVAKAGRRRGTENPNLIIGSLWHAYLRLFFSGNKHFNLESVRFVQSRRVWTPSERAKAEARRLFGAFRTRFEPDIFGHVTAVEQPFRVTKAPWLPKGMVLTGRTDLEVTVRARHQKVMERAFGVKVPLGDYIVDHKTSGSSRYLNSYDAALQFVTYLEARRLKKKKLQGMLINVGVKSNPADFRLVHRPMPTENERTFLRRWLAEAYELSLERPPRMRDACYDFGEAKPCLHMTTGMCPRR